MSTALDTELAKLLPEMQIAERALRRAALDAGIEYTIADFGSLRSEADTTRILGYRATDYAVYVANLKRSNPRAVPLPIGTWRPIAKFGSSYHNYGAAIDLTITRRPASMSSSRALLALGAFAPRAGLRWGGNFSPRVDPPHFELAVSLSEARRLWNARVPTSRTVAPSGRTSAGLLVVVAALLALFFRSTR